MAADYSFVSRWRVPAPRERVWTELVRMLELGGAPSWWRAVTVTERPDALGAGALVGLRVRSPLGYALRVRLVITAVEAGRLLAADGVGDLTGAGRIEIEEAEEHASVVIIHWDVATTRAWMNRTAWVLRPAFERAHARVMLAGEAGLRRALDEQRR
ncbi:hypothetical protein GCM10022200_03310 [Microbacterium awajiense]|uniref:Polyketide cyclase n=1 Tax=Microbacterium awajiense TaxID=415214 RepID=A0ABP7A3S6_9MICO